MSASISIAMATFNGEKYLKKQLESLARQTVPPLELVICDDCSSDATVAIITHFASSAPFPVRIYRNEVNLGNSDNFFKAAGLCCGQWIAFCDQDDVWLQNKLARLSLVIDRCPGNELMLVAHTSLVANENLELLNYRLPNFRRDAYVKRGEQFAIVCISGFSIAFRAILVKDIDPKLRPMYMLDGLGNLLGHDGWVTMLANVLGDSFHISAPLAIWRRHNQSTTPFGYVSKLALADQSIKEKVSQSLKAVKPEQYAGLGRQANTNAEFFRNISRRAKDEVWMGRLSAAAADNLTLAMIGFKRAELYQASAIAERTRKLI